MDARRKLPPPIPVEARRSAQKKEKPAPFDAAHLQEADRVEAFELLGFKGLEVYATMEKKDISKTNRAPNRKMPARREHF